MGITVVVLELFMLGLVLFKNVLAKGGEDSSWFVRHASAYLLLLLVAAVLVVYSLLYKKKKIKNKVLGYFLKNLFCLVSLSFGLYISYISLNPTSQVFAFLTMEIFVLCIYAWNPVQSFAISVLSFALYLYLQSRLGPVYYGTKINSFTAWLFIFTCALNTFYQKKSSAKREEELESLIKFVREKSSQDELTGLANLHKFQYDSMHFLQGAGIELEQWRFVFMDIVNFKNYNEKYGFSAGNAFLKIFGQYVTEEFPGELVARYSDDHFIRAEGLIPRPLGRNKGY